MSSLRVPFTVYDDRLSRVGESAVIISSLFVVGSFFWFPILVGYFLKKVCTTTKRRIILALTVLALVFAPVKPWDRARRNWIFDQWIRYFSVRVVFEEALDKSRPAIFCMSPHGLYPFAQAIALTGRLSALFNDMRPVAADMALRFPIFRQLCGWVGAIGASPSNISKHLRAGESLCLIPGGIAEMFYSSPKKDIALLRDRKGFVRLALENGADIVPVYCFGNNKVLKMASWVHHLQWISRLMRASILFFWGRWGLPIPFKVPLLYAVGAPIHVPTMAKNDITQAHIDQIHAHFIDAMEQLYAKYKSVAGQSTSQLEIL